MAPLLLFHQSRWSSSRCFECQSLLAVFVDAAALTSVYCARLTQYLTEALDKLELSQTKLARATEEKEKALKRCDALQEYIDELQKVHARLLCLQVCISVCVRACMCQAEVSLHFPAPFLPPSQ